jgi:hypothetical protein
VEPALKNLALNIGPLLVAQIPISELKRVQRWKSYLYTFPNVTLASLDLLDDASKHFEIYKNGSLFGGFRLTSIVNGQSEIEAVFPNYPFSPGSMELGRLWVYDSSHRSGIQFTREVFKYVSQNRISVYYKTRKELGEYTVKFGLKALGLSSFNRNLQYECHLYCSEHK